MVAPTVDPPRRNGLVYVDLPQPGGARGRHVRPRRVRLGARPLTLPQTAVLLRDGFSYVLRVGADSRVQRDQGAGRPPRGDRIEITGGPAGRCAGGGAGAGFLSDGDTVRVVAAPGPRNAGTHAAGERHAAPEVSGHERLRLVDPQPDSVGPAVRAAHAGRPAGLPGDEDPELPRHRPAHRQRHRQLPGAAPAQLETEVARKIENSIATLQGVKHIYTKVQDGTATSPSSSGWRSRRRRRWTTCAMRSRACAPTCRPTCATR
jgi:hypothetical protein